MLQVKVDFAVRWVEPAPGTGLVMEAGELTVTSHGRLHLVHPHNVVSVAALQKQLGTIRPFSNLSGRRYRIRNSILKTNPL